MPFLTARWSNLCLWTYPAPPHLLQPHLPPGLELDTRDGTAFVSLVAFDFLDTRVLRIAWPGHRNFPEINFRTYVRRPAAPGEPPERGVLFLREFISKPLVATVARLFYNEPYAVSHLYSGQAKPPKTLSLQQREPSGSAAGPPSDNGTPETLTIKHQLLHAGRLHTMAMSGQGPATCPDPSSTEHFFKEQRWGFGRSRSGRLLRYEVIHPTWSCYRVTSQFVDLDFAAVYGPQWCFLNDTPPVSTILAAGSEITISPKSTF